MKWSFATIGMFVLGVIGVAIIILFQKLTTSNENDYYLLKEITEAAMYDSIDIKYYRETGELKISREKFVENFTRRYSESTLFIGSKYIISFYDIMEMPPKASIIIDTEIQDYQIYGEDTRADYNVGNILTGILEFVGKNTNKENPYTEGKMISKVYYSMPTINNGKIVFTEPINKPIEISTNNIKNIKIKNIDYAAISNDNLIGSVLMAKMKKELDWTRATNKEANYETNYFEEINSNNYETSFYIDNNKIDYYNCIDSDNRSYEGTGTDCTGKYSDYWIHWTGTSSGIQWGNAVLKLNITWQYDEYEY